MILALRLLLLLAGFSAVAAASQPTFTDLVFIGGGLGAAFLAVWAAALAKARPMSDIVAWLATVVPISMVVVPPVDATMTALLGASIVLLLAALHLPASDAPPARGVSPTWIIAGGAAFLLVWLPVVLDSGQISAVDPRTAPGAAMRVALAATALALAAALLSWMRGAAEARRQKASSDGG